MGAPKRIRKKYETPSMMWDSARIQREHDLKEKYGLKNLRELWMLASEIRRIRKNVREVLAGRLSEDVGKNMVARLSRYNIVKSDATPDDLLVVGVESLLERRLQTIVFRRGLARSMKQARQLVAHGLISVSSRRAKSPGHLVLASEEGTIRYYKPITIEPIQVAAAPQAPAPAPESPAAEAAPSG